MLEKQPLPDFESEPYASAEQRQALTKRSTWVSIGVNFFLASLQIGIGIFSRSQALIADGFHSLADLLADFIVLGAARHSQRDADDSHPYGHLRIETAASLALGLALVITGLGMLWSAATQLQNPAAIAKVAPIALWVALLTLVSKELLFRYMLRRAKSVKSSMLVANAWHARADAASSLVVSLGIAGNLLGYPLLDPIAALIVGLMIAKTGFGFAWDASHQLLDHAADDKEVAAIRDTILSTPGVLDVHDLRTRQMGDMIVADAHIEVTADITVREGHDIAVEARRRVMQRHRVLNLMTHIDPAGAEDGDHEKIA